MRFVVQRYQIEGKKTFGQYTRAAKKGVKGWLKTLAMDKDRPLYRLREVLDAPKDRQIMVTEGEKCAEAVAENSKKALPTCWAGGTGAWRKTDWSPLYGRPLLLVADGDRQGHKCMTEIAKHLSAKCPDIMLVLPPLPEKGKKSRDIANEIEAGTNVAKWLRDHTQEYQAEQQAPAPDIKVDDELGKNEYFTLLGNVDSMVAIKLWTNQVLMATRQSLCTRSQLIAIAPDHNWWITKLQCDALSNGVALVAGGGLLRLADRLGQIDVSRVLNRGATRNDRGEIVWHLGDRLIVNNTEHDLNYADGNIYVSGPAIELGGEALDPVKRAELADVLMGYRWNTPMDGKRMLGWIVSSLMGGILEWRPHLWMLGSADVGKSWWSKNVIRRIHHTASARMSAPTEASISRIMRSASLPLLLDEAEPDRSWLEGVVALCRIAAGGDGDRARADATSQGFTLTSPRFSALMSSTKLPHLPEADNSRFVLVRMSPHGVEGWPDLETRILGALAPPSPIPAQLRRAIIADTAFIAEEANAIARGLQAEGVGSREAMIRGALSAGWQWWSGTSEVLTARQPRSVEKESDAAEALLEILGHRIRTSSGEDRSLLDLLGDGDVASEKLAGSYGVGILDDGLAIATTHPSVRRTLVRSRFKEADVTALLCQIPGVTKAKNSRHVGKFRTRPVIVPYERCEAIGIDLGDTRKLA